MAMNSDNNRPRPGREMDLMLRVAALEQGLLPEPEVMRLYTDLINSGMVWSLSGVLQDAARTLIERGLIKFAN